MRIPEGWSFWTSERSCDDAWRMAIEYKQTHERAQGDVFVRVRVVPAAGTYWILTREEQRQ